MHMLMDQPGNIRLYKLVTKDGRSPISPGQGYGSLTYAIGQTVEVERPETDIDIECGAGVNVASLDWCMKQWKEGWRILIVEFTAADIACIPTATDGKIRLYRCKVVGEKDLKAIGLVKQ